jgi:DNA-binding response OmpR family regulator
LANRILVIEDDRALADVLRMKLERDGHQVIIAPSQRDAYHLLDGHSFDFALLDLRLPTHVGDMDPNAEVGFAILKHIRERLSPETFPVMVMTAYEETSQTAVRALRTGANDYITKPFEDSPVSLDEKLRALVSCVQHTKRPNPGTTTASANKAHQVVFRAGRVELNGIVVEGRFADLMLLLGRRALMLSLDTAGDTTPKMTGKEIATALGVQEATVRQQVTRFRKWLASAYAARSLGPLDDQAVIRNERDWKGYYLNRDGCDLRTE